MTICIDLRRHCLAGGQQAVAIGAEHHFSGEQLRARACELGQALAARPEQRWGIWYSNAWDFLCGFMALALANKHIVMPHNRQAGTAQVLAQHYQALLTDVPLAQTSESDTAEVQLTPAQLLAGPRTELPEAAP